MAAKMNSLLQEIYETFGWKTRIIAPLAGRYVYAVLKKEERRLANGWTYEPDCFMKKCCGLDPGKCLTALLRTAIPQKLDTSRVRLPSSLADNLTYRKFYKLLKYFFNGSPFMPSKWKNGMLESGCLKCRAWPSKDTEIKPCLEMSIGSIY